jgi:hypothetical protein
MIMATPVFDFPVVEFCWYGAVSLMALICFASLSHEVRRALFTMELDEEARAVVFATYHVNFVVMVVANLALIASCVGIAVADSESWRGWFSLSILACGGYWFYTRACEKKMLAYLRDTRGGSADLRQAEARHS